MSGGLLQRICNRDETEEDEDTQRKEQRQIVRGILADNEDVLEFFDTPSENNRLYVQVDTDTLNELKELDCFDECSFDGRRAIGWANRHSKNVEVYVEIIDTDETFSVELEYVGSTTLDNEMISDFADRFHRSISTTFDPLGEDHDEPCLIVRPW